MAREIKLEELYPFLNDASYPMTVDAAAEEFADVTVQLADGSTNLGEVVGRSTSGPFATTDELASEVLSLLPREAVGEPFQSEGEG